MKQFNVRDETHKLGRELSLRTGKSMLDVIHEALESYGRSLEGNEDESRILQKAADVTEERMCKVVHEEVHHALDEIVRLQEELRQQQAKELEQALQETMPEAPEDDLKEVPYEELYGRQ